MKEAILYRKLNEEPNRSVKCGLCSHNCTIPEGKRGICNVRVNVEGRLYSLVYGKAIAAHVDPIEKKPFFNFLPGTKSYSIATAGCNFRCKFCQNWNISQALNGQNSKIGEGNMHIPGSNLEPKEIVTLAKKHDCKSIAYTYTEPTIFFEYAYDTSKLANKEGIYNVFVTNGYMTKDALDTISPFLDAANVDLKAFTDKFYREICSARLDPVLETMKRMKKQNIWLEVTTLVIPTLNDSMDELLQIAEFIKSELGAETPWHISRFHQDYKMMDLPETDTETIHKAREIGLETGLRYVYAGNLPGYFEACERVEDIILECLYQDETNN